VESLIAAIREFLRQFVELLHGLLALAAEGDDVSRRKLERDGYRLIAVTIFSGILKALVVGVVVMSAAYMSTVQSGPDGTLAYTARPTDKVGLFFLVLFVLCLVALVQSRRFISTQSATLTESIVAKTRIRIVDQLRRANLLRYEQTVKFEIDAALNQSTAIISASAQSIANGMSSALMLVCATAYIAFLSRPAFVLVMGCIVGGVCVYSINFKRFRQEMQQSSNLERAFFDLLRHLLEGFKEVKMNQTRNDDLYTNHLVQVAREAQEVKQRTVCRHANFDILNEVVLYGILGVIVFILPSYNPQDAGKIIQFAAVILFIMGPLGELVRAVPVVMLSHDAVDRIATLEKHLAFAADPAARAIVVTPTEKRAFHDIQLDNVTFAYDKSPTAEFKLEVRMLDVRSGEVLFLIGGNGSGKSTLLKVLVGLYEPDRGSILIDHQPVTSSNLAEYRSMFSTVFTDFHLFDRLYGLRKEDYPAAQRLLQTMELDGLVSIDSDGRFIDPHNNSSDGVTSKLSTGQKKRLALVVALSENRGILVLDEFAADQDPMFRKKFYMELLPEFRTNRTIIVATHDEHYFKDANPDRILEMDFGHFKDVTQQYKGTGT
jgi:cyclic peptide transporter